MQKVNFAYVLRYIYLYIKYVHILKVVIFFWSHCVPVCGVISQKMLIKSQNHNIFPIFEMNPTRPLIPFPMMCSFFGWFVGVSFVLQSYYWDLGGGGGGGAPRTTSISYSAKVCISCRPALSLLVLL